MTMTTSINFDISLSYTHHLLSVFLQNELYIWAKKTEDKWENADSFLYNKWLPIKELCHRLISSKNKLWFIQGVSSWWKTLFCVFFPSFPVFKIHFSIVFSVAVKQIKKILQTKAPRQKLEIERWPKVIFSMKNLQKTVNYKEFSFTNVLRIFSSSNS